jgi:Bromodomain
MYNLTGTKEFCDMFPNMEDRLDLHEINRRCKRGKYEETSGLASLFEDLTLMCTNGKKFNSGNVGFQPWVMVDMMEKTLLNILLSQKGSLTQFNRGCIISSATASSTSQSHRSNGLQTGSNVDDDPFEEEDNEVRSTMLNDLDQEEFTQEV